MLIDWTFCHKTLRRKLLNGRQLKSCQRKTREPKALFPYSGALVAFACSPSSALLIYLLCILTSTSQLATLWSTAIRDGSSIRDEADTVNQVSLVSLRAKENVTGRGGREAQIRLQNVSSERRT